MFDNSIALKVQVPDSFERIGKMLNMANTAKELQMREQAIEKQRATMPSDINIRAQESKQADIGTEAKRYDLTGQYVQNAKEEGNALLQDPDVISGNQQGILAKVLQRQASMMTRGTPYAIAKAYTDPILELAQKDPKQVRQYLATQLQSGLGASSQAAQNLIPASSQNSVGGADLRGNPTVVNRDQFGNVSRESLQTQNQMTPPQLVIPTGESQQTYQQLAAEREIARGIRNDAPNMHSLAKEILAELPLAATGQYGGLIAKGQSVAGTMGLSLTGNNDSERAASAYDLIDKYSTQLALEAAKRMGGAGAGTVAGLEANIKAGGSVSRNPTSVAKTIKRNDAIVTGSELYYEGLDKSISNNPELDNFAKREYDKEWARNFDPLIFQIYNAQKNGDMKELQDLLNPGGNPLSQKELETIRKKAATIKNLSTRGI